MKLLVVARDELARLLATRRGWISLIGFAVLWVLVMRYCVLPAAGFLGDGSGEQAYGGLGPAILNMLGLAALSDWPSPQLAAYWLVVLSLLPPFVLLIAADQTASDRARGTIRFQALRAGRGTLFLGRMLGQLLVFAGLIVLTLASVLLVVFVQMPDRLSSSLAVGPLVFANLMLTVFPWIALMALCSALARSPRQATLFAFMAWAIGSLLIAWLQNRFGPLPALEHVLPGSETSSLRRLNDAAMFGHASAPLIQGLVLSLLGVIVFWRRDL